MTVQFSNHNIVTLLLGGNIGDTIQLIHNAENRIIESLGRISAQSSFYKSEPWGFEHTNWFVNKVIQIETEKTVEQVLDTILSIETTLGRERPSSSGYHARTIDIDILFFNNASIHTNNLTVPHPRLHLRAFTLLPLAEIMPKFIHPELSLSIAQLLNDCEDNGKIVKI